MTSTATTRTFPPPVGGGTIRALARQVWLAVRPTTAQQRFLCGALMLASGTVHVGVAVVDWAPWWGAVSWRKPVVFGVSFGILAWSAVWLMRQLPVRRWGWVPVAVLGGGSVVEVLLISMQPWRGEPSHFNYRTSFDATVWAVMGGAILLVTLALTALLSGHCCSRGVHRRFESLRSRACRPSW